MAPVFEGIAAIHAIPESAKSKEEGRVAGQTFF
jgi:hypothetical protein